MKTQMPFTDRDEALVTEATKRAVAQMRWRDRWLRAIAFFLAGAVSSASIAIAATYVITHNNDVRTAQRAHASENRNARTNCELVRHLATVQRERLLENKANAERFQRESLDRFGLSPQRFEALLRRSQAAERRQLNIYRGIAAFNCGGLR